MPTFSRSRFVRSRRFRRPKRFAWQAFSTGSGTLTGTNNIHAELIGRATLDKMTNPTVMRIRGELVATINVPTAPTQSAVVLFWGIHVVDQLTFSIPASVEDPFNHSFSNDWMWHGTTYLATGNVANDSRNGTLAAARIPFDVRSKRKLDQTDLLVVSFTSVQTTAPGSIGAAITGRALFQEV